MARAREEFAKQAQAQEQLSRALAVATAAMAEQSFDQVRAQLLLTHATLRNAEAASIGVTGAKNEAHAGIKEMQKKVLAFESEHLSDEIQRRRLSELEAKLAEFAAKRARDA